MTASFNHGRFIEDNIRSVLGQTYPRIEHLIIDGGSTDNTLEVLRKYSDRVRWISEADGGQADAISKGFTMAQGDVIAGVDSDDFYLDAAAVAAAVRVFERRPEVAVLYGDNVWVDEANTLLKVQHRPPRFSRSRLLRLDFLPYPSVFLRRSVVTSVPMNLGLRFAIDYDWWLSISEAGFRFEHLDRVVSATRWHRGAKSSAEHAEALAESVRVRAAHGQRFGRAYYAGAALDVAYLGVLKALGVITIWKWQMGLRPRRAVPLRTNGPFTITLRQLNLIDARPEKSLIRYLFTARPGGAGR